MSKQKYDDDELERRGMPGWKIALLVAAAAFLLIGLGLRFLGGGEKAGSSGSPEVSTSFIPGTGSETGSGTSADAAEGNEWSPFFLKGGLGFFLGFSIGLALRSFFKLSVLAVGVIALALIGLNYMGAVDIDWERLQGLYDSVAGRIATEAENLKTFVQGTLPATAISGLGFLAGFKKG